MFRGQFSIDGLLISNTVKTHNKEKQPSVNRKWSELLSLLSLSDLWWPHCDVISWWSCDSWSRLRGLSLPVCIHTEETEEERRRESLWMNRRLIYLLIDWQMKLSVCVVCVLLISCLLSVNCRLPDVTPATHQQQVGQVHAGTPCEVDP